METIITGTFVGTLHHSPREMDQDLKNKQEEANVLKKIRQMNQTVEMGHTERLTRGALDPWRETRLCIRHHPKYLHVCIAVLLFSSTTYITNNNTIIIMIFVTNLIL